MSTYETMMISVLRTAFDKKIAINPAYVKVDVRPMIDNGYGTPVPDLNADAVPTEFGPVRIASASSPVLQTQGAEGVLGISNDFILFGKHTDDWIVDELVFTWNEMKFKVSKPTHTTRYNEIISIIAHLVNVTE